jgi:hypothetical protein
MVIDFLFFHAVLRMVFPSPKSLPEVQNPTQLEVPDNPLVAPFCRPVESVTFVFYREFSSEKNARPVEGVPELASLIDTCTWRLPLRTLMFVALMFVEEDHASSRQPGNRGLCPAVHNCGSLSTNRAGDCTVIGISEIWIWNTTNSISMSGNWNPESLVKMKYCTLGLYFTRITVQTTDLCLIGHRFFKLQTTKNVTYKPSELRNLKSFESTISSVLVSSRSEPDKSDGQKTRVVFLFFLFKITQLNLIE